LENFILNGKAINTDDLPQAEKGRGHFSDFEFKTISIVREWMLGKNEFSFQTSGSTGKPKTITFTRAQIDASAKRTISVFSLQKSHTLLCCINTQFVAGFMMIIRAMVGNMKLIVLEPSTNPISNLEPWQNIDFVAMTPIQVQSAIELTPEKFSKIRTLLIGGAGLDSALERKLRMTDCKIYHSYAMTETLTHVAIRQLGNGESDPIYHALPGVTFEKDDRDCLIIHDEILGINQLRTNDLVELSDNRSFCWKGRLDNVINSGGIKIQVDQLEIDIQKILVEMGITAPFCLVAKPDEKLTNKLVLMIEKTETTFDQEKVLKHLKASLARFHDPKEIVMAPKLFQTKSGKIDRLKNTSVYILNH
jgi:O-succinylbenzoic acid--CoA ligase